MAALMLRRPSMHSTHMWVEHNLFAGAYWTSSTIRGSQLPKGRSDVSLILLMHLMYWPKRVATSSR
eukprot:1268755-Amphidinium_carterae.1